MTDPTNVEKIHIIQGDLAVSTSANAIISTLLGSCVSCCLWDPVHGVGGMNHLVLAGRVSGNVGLDPVGLADMETLINAMAKQGAERDCLQAKVFGGADLLRNQMGIGKSNSDFVFEFLHQERIPCVNASVGGKLARSIKFWPTTGRVSQRLVSDVVPEPTADRERTTGNDLELFGKT